MWGIYSIVILPQIEREAHQLMRTQSVPRLQMRITVLRAQVFEEIRGVLTRNSRTLGLFNFLDFTVLFSKA